MRSNRKRIEPGPGQESVWDYPRPPRLEKTDRHLIIECGDQKIVDSKNAIRVLETSHPPVYYFPRQDVQMNLLVEAIGSTFCEWKGHASYFDLVTPEQRILRAAWCYPDPTAAFTNLKDYLAFYPSKMDRCTVDGELIKSQAGDFYGGWITSEIVGPFKGEPGTGFW